MIRVGLIGLGFMGMTHYRAMRKVRGAKVAAICTRDPKKRAGDWRTIQGNFGERGGIEDLAGVATHDTIDAILADPTVDLIDITLPTPMHADVAIAALAAGKHVLVEKPIAGTLAEADRMLRAARRARRQLMVGQVLAFFPEYQYLREAVAGGRYGKLLAAHFTRLTARPSDWSRVRGAEGPVISLHIHDMHFILLLCGRPEKISARGIVREDVVVYAASTLRFPDPDVTVTATTGWISQPARPFTQQFEIYLERATLSYEFATLAGKPHAPTPLVVLTADGKVRHPRLRSTDPVDAFTAELQHAVDVLRGRADPAVIGGPFARDALSLCLLEASAVRRGRILTVR